MKLINVFKHIKLVIKHKWVVFKLCCKIGNPIRGFLHDWSKFSPTEFFESTKYYDGHKSPILVCKADKGYSDAWLHHKGRNKHHYEYWLDYSPNAEIGLQGNKMPVKYVVEMFIDRMAACKTYYGEDYKNDSPLNYFLKNQGHYTMHEDTMELLEKLLTMLANEGEEPTLKYIKKVLLRKKKSK